MDLLKLIASPDGAEEPVDCVPDLSEMDANGGLIVALRNLAPDMLAAIEAAEAALKWLDEVQYEHDDRAVKEPLRAALAKLRGR